MHSNASSILSGAVHPPSRGWRGPGLPRSSCFYALHRAAPIVERSLIASTSLAVDIEVSRRGDGHHGHHAGLHRVADDEVGSIRDATGHVQREYDDPFVTDLADGLGDVAAHQRAG